MTDERPEAIARMRAGIACLCLAACTAPSPAPDAGAASPDAAVPDAGFVLPDDARMTTSGPVRGRTLGGSLVFKGIPYAAAPQRWKPAVPPARWEQLRDAFDFGPACTQVDANGAVVGDEDCLTLNVWAPGVVSTSLLPVLVFIHGGNNQIGCSCDAQLGQSIFDGQHIAENGPAVVVTLNYRLAAFGFLAHPAFAAENASGSTGDYGLRDQLLALRWVHDNIAAFGGDPARVLAFGHSAGSLDLAALVASPLSVGLFQRAALHSGASVTVSPASVQRTWAAAEKALGCDAVAAPEKAECLRAASADAIARVPGAVLGAPNPDLAQFNPTVDAEVLPATPLERVRQGLLNPVPMMIGTTADEYEQLVSLLVSQPLTTEAAYESEVKALLGDGLGGLTLQHYPSADYASPQEAYVALVGDLYMICPTRLLARAFAQSPGQPPTWRFIYAHAFSGPLAKYRAAHAFDIYLLFHDVFLFGDGADDSALSDAMLRYWVRFAQTGDPNEGADPAWPPHAAATDDYQRLDWPISQGHSSRSAQCDFWESQGLGAN